MTSLYTDHRHDRDSFRIPVIRVAFALSLAIHAAALFPWMKPIVSPSPPDNTEKGANRFQVRMAPIPVPAAPSASAPSPPPARRPAPQSARKASPPPPVMALNTPGPAPAAPASPPEPPPAPAVRSPAPPPAMDMAALIEARRQSRGEPAPASVPRAPTTDDENRRRDRIVAENLGSQRTPSFGQQPSGSGGIFQVEHVYYDYADFTFYGWHRDIKRNTRQLIEVRKGNAADIRIAVVRKMISIIREYEQEEFRWESTRLGRSITLSARQRDNAGLEDFLMTEFFEDFQRRR